MKIQICRFLILSLIFSASISNSIAPAISQTQYDLDMQAQSKYDAADKQLNTVYKQLLKSYSDSPNTLKELKASEKAWIIYRDAEAKFECSQSEGGSIYPMEYSEAMTTLTLDRIKQLKAQASE